MIKVNIQPKTGQPLTRTVVILLATAIDFVEDLTDTVAVFHKNEANQEKQVPHG